MTYNIKVYGIVQGVGFRPFVSRTCQNNGIKGTVANRGSYVEIFAQGQTIDPLLEALENSPPDRSVILNIIKTKLDPAPSYDDFQIIESEKDQGEIFVSPDIAICDKCKAELYDKNNRRYMHPFINCTSCGPRLTILESMPYDRERTSMKEFEMCPECQYEYSHPETRRYDAQPVCCPNCGPRVYTFDPKTSDSKDLNNLTYDREAIIKARKAIIEGKIVAIKGIGGFHLCCDATNKEAVSRLRLLKHRPMKPFAVMMKDEDTVKRECVYQHHSLLTGHQKPIILLKKKENTRLADSVAPDNPNIGVMLPYTPIHLLLFDYDDEYTCPDCLVMTSANASGAPICRTDQDTISEISNFTDLVLSNNRTIRTRADDTVTDFYRGKPYMIRRSRGFAPLPVMISNDMKGSVLAIGGELKNSFCIAKDKLLYPSAYVGDLADIRTVQALEDSIKRMEELLEVKPQLVVSDLHPNYNSTALAEDMDLPLLKIQHHYAHILSCMAENDYLDPVIGVSFDGTGYGSDGSIWGGEYLLCNTSGFERLGHISPFIQSGGDLSSKEGWRIAASILGDFKNGENAYSYSDIEKLNLCSETEFNLLKNMANAGINSVTSTSAGRLFDGMSAILGIRHSSTFEGEASTALMFSAMKELEACDSDYLSAIKYGSHLVKDIRQAGKVCPSNVDTSPLNDIYDTNQLLRYLTNEYLSGQDKERLALLFHIGLAHIITEEVSKYSDKTGLDTIMLSGGVFQNLLLLAFTEDSLKARGLKVYHHSLIPPNDGGIALGQALAGLDYLNK
ncbi:MAG: carbamoyltransferase HypF [Eubacterium sp.]|nr:carbamoyltransferase HypF [Eubacterium sp.]